MALTVDTTETYSPESIRHPLRRIEVATMNPLFLIGGLLVLVGSGAALYSYGWDHGDAPDRVRLARRIWPAFSMAGGALLLVAATVR